MELMISQRNQLLEIIKSNELDPFNFEWYKEDSRGEIASFLKYKDTEYLFGIKISPNKFEWFAAPGMEYLYEKNMVHSWDKVVISFIYWLNYLKREISQPDLWAELEKIKLFDKLPLESNVENKPMHTMEEFSYREVLQLEQGINDIRNYLVEEVKGNTKEIKIVNEKLDYLIDATKRMGRIDWKNIFIGVVIDLMMAIGMDPAQRQVLGQLAQNTISGIIRLLSFK